MYTKSTDVKKDNVLEVIKMKAVANKKAKEKQTTLVGLDVGFGALKYISNAHPYLTAIPSAVVPGKYKTSNKLVGSKEIDPENLVVETEEGTFTVGQLALKVPNTTTKRTVVRDRANDVFSKVLFQTGLGMAVPHQSGEYDVFLVTGLPNKDFELSIKDNLEEFLNKSFTITFPVNGGNEIKKKINVVGLEIMRQPEGAVTYNQFTFSPEEFLMPSENAKNFIGIIDCGHFTTDYSLFRDGVIMEDAITSNSTVAVNDVYKRLRKVLTIKFDKLGYTEYQAEEEDLDNAVLTGKVEYVEEHDVSKEVEECVKTVAKIIAKDILDAWGNETNRVQTILLSGGGSALFSDALKQEFEDRKKRGFEVLDVAQFSNVLGYYMYGCIALTDEKEQSEVFSEFVVPVFSSDEEVAETE